MNAGAALHKPYIDQIMIVWWLGSLGELGMHLYYLPDSVRLCEPNIKHVLVLNRQRNCDGAMLKLNLSFFLGVTF